MDVQRAYGGGGGVSGIQRGFKVDLGKVQEVARCESLSRGCSVRAGSLCAHTHRHRHTCAIREASRMCPCVCVHAHVAVLTQTHSHCHGWDYRRSLSIIIDIS